jgi:HEAT repeat protein
MAFKNLDPSAQELAMPGLIQVYEQSISTSSHSYEAVIEVWMYSMGLAAKKAIPSLLLGVTNANASVRSQSLSALGRIHSEPAVVVPIFIKSLNDSDATVRWVAAGYLGSHALDARPAVPALIELLKDTNSTGLNLMVRKEATNALKKIDPESAAKAGVK